MKFFSKKKAIWPTFLVHNLSKYKQRDNFKIFHIKNPFKIQMYIRKSLHTSHSCCLLEWKKKTLTPTPPIVSSILPMFLAVRWAPINDWQSANEDANPASAGVLWYLFYVFVLICFTFTLVVSNFTFFG